MNKDLESKGDGHNLPAKGEPKPPALMEVTKIHRRGGYLVGVAGWSGLAFWLMNKLFSFLTFGVVWAIFIAIGWIVTDETLRTAVRSVLGVSPTPVLMDIERSAFSLLETEEYQTLPANWKQLLAEVQFNQSNYPARFVSMLQELTSKDIGVISRIAPYVVGNSVIQADDFEMGYEIPSVSDMDFERLKTIGVTTEGQFGIFVDIKPQDGQPGHHWFRGTTLALLVRSRDSTTEHKVHAILLTEEGGRIVRLLNEPTSFRGVCGIASRLKKRKEIQTFIFATLKPDPMGDSWSDRDELLNVSELCSRFGLSLVD